MHCESHVLSMLILELSIFPKASAKVPLSNNVRLTGIHHATRINNIVKYSRMLNTTKPSSESDHDINITKKKEKDNKKSLNQDKCKRPRGRPPKDRETNHVTSTVVHEKSNMLDKFTDATSYLEYASFKMLKPTSSVFMGNLYELQVKNFLEQSFKIRRTLHQGGSNDKGIDINAIWNPTSVFQNENSDDSIKKKTRYEIVNMKKVKPIIQRSNQTLKLFVQCKCYDTSKIDPKLIREIKGSCQEYFKKKGNSAVFMIASTNGFTKTGKEDFDKATIPLIYVKFSKPKLLDPKHPYNIKSWEIGNLVGMYLNPLATALFKGLDWIKFTNKLLS